MIDDGRMLVRVTELQGPEWVRNYQRWSIRLGCEGVHEPVSLSLFINLGNDPAGPRVAGRQSKYYKHWSMANGQPPAKGQSMAADVFLDKFFMAQVEKATKGTKGEAKGDEEIYSRIIHFIRLEEMSLPHTP